MRIRGRKFGQVAVYGKAAAGVVFTGPGDVVSGASAWWSPARAYNAAYATGSNPCMDLVDQSNANPITINILSTGFVDKTAITTWVAAHSVTTIFVAQLYDQTGNACHASASFGSQPILTLNTLNTLPVLLLSSAGSTRLQAATTITGSSPFTLSTVYNNTSGSTGGIISPLAAPPMLKAGPAANQINLDDGSTNPTVTASDGAWHGMQAVFNAAATAANVSGVDTTALAGTACSLSAVTLRIGRDGSGGSVDGSWAEGGIWLSGFNATQRGNMYSNQNGASGYNGSV